MLPQGEANEQLVWIQQDSQVLTVLNHTSDERGDVSVSDAYWNITNVPMGGALADAGVDAAVYGEALAAVDRRVRRFWNSAVLECCLVLLIFFATVLPLDLLGLGEGQLPLGLSPKVAELLHVGDGRVLGPKGDLGAHQEPSKLVVEREEGTPSLSVDRIKRAVDVLPHPNLEITGRRR